MANEPGLRSGAASRNQRFTRYAFHAPSPRETAAVLVVLLPILAAVTWLPAGGGSRFAVGLAVVFVAPTLVGLLLTGPIAVALGGRFPLRRSVLLAVMAAGLALPILLVWRLVGALDPDASVGVVPILLLLQGPALWFRHMTLFGVSRPGHARSLPASLVQPLAAVVAIFALVPPTPAELLAAAVFLGLGFGCAALLLRTADRPLRREFSISGVSLIRPLLDHVNARDPAATATIEAFFRRFAIPADLRVTLVAFRDAAGPVATIALPTVHPGPFAALGASDLPRKLAESLGPSAGTVLVPHTPCNHDLDLPSGAEVARVAGAARELLAGLPAPGPTRASPLVAGRPGSVVRAQRLGDTVLVLVSQAPAPTDDIDFAVADQLVREYADRLPIALIDAHNSYVEDQGDVVYGTPSATRMLDDARAAIAAAEAASRPGPIEVGAAERGGYSIGRDGIGPAGIRAVAVRAAGTTTAYVLVDGNNLVVGHRAPILAALAGVVDTAEVMTTDNHVVHEVDGGVNAVGERLAAEDLAREVRAVVAEAVAALRPAQVRVGTRPIPAVPVLGPAWTARLLTSLGDTVSVFANALLMTFLLLITGSLAVLLALR